MRALWVDRSAHTHLAVCALPGCPWRHLTDDPDTATRALLDHVTACHPDRAGLLADRTRQKAHRRRSTEP